MAGLELRRERTVARKEAGEADRRIPCRGMAERRNSVPMDETGSGVGEDDQVKMATGEDDQVKMATLLAWPV